MELTYVGPGPSRVYPELRGPGGGVLVVAPGDVAELDEMPADGLWVAAGPAAAEAASAEPAVPAGPAEPVQWVDEPGPETAAAPDTEGA